MLWTMIVTASDYKGRVLDEEGYPLMYATVYLQSNPEIGTATNKDGYFTLTDISVPSDAVLIISCIGYTTQQLPLSFFLQDGGTVRLVEQPILLTTTIVDAKKTRQSKRKKMASLLHAVYERLQEESSKRAVQYQVVSDVKMTVNMAAWGMEQMVAWVVEIPSDDITKEDSVQYVGLSCKRYCDPRVRTHVDSLYRQETDKQRKQLALSIDSGTIVHRKMWEMSQMDKSVLLDLSDELGRWQSASVDDQHIMLTYTRKRTYFLGVVQTVEQHHLLVDNNASLQTYAMDMTVKIFLPFSIRIKDADLSWVNLLNMDDDALQKFRLKKANMHVRMETHYSLRDGVRLPKDKTMHLTAQLEDNKGRQLPCEIWANQQVVALQTENVSPFPYYRKGQRVSRRLVPIY